MPPDAGAAVAPLHVSLFSLQDPAPPPFPRCPVVGEEVKSSGIDGPRLVCRMYQRKLLFIAEKLPRFMEARHKKSVRSFGGCKLQGSRPVLPLYSRLIVFFGSQLGHLGIQAPLASSRACAVYLDALVRNCWYDGFITIDRKS